MMEGEGAVGGGGMYLRSEYSRENLDRNGRGVRPSGVSRERSKQEVHPERSWSAPPVRVVAPKCVSREMKQQRASLAAHALQELEQQSEENLLQRRGISQLYEWLKTVSLQEHLPALLELGVEDVSHLADLEVEDLEEAGLARPERKRFLRKQALLSLALPRPRSGLFVQSACALANDTGELTFSARSNLSTGTSSEDESIGVDPPSTERTTSSSHCSAPAAPNPAHHHLSSAPVASAASAGPRANANTWRRTCSSEEDSHGSSRATQEERVASQAGGGGGGRGGGGGESGSADVGEKPPKPAPSHARGDLPCTPHPCLKQCIYELVLECQLPHKTVNSRFQLEKSATS